MSSEFGFKKRLQSRSFFDKLSIRMQTKLGIPLVFFNNFEIQKTKKLINPVLFLLFGLTWATSEPGPGGGSKLRNGEASKK